ncbi:hypothetical protein FBU30_005520 [Linnemannia zychae]|nr:hypothetical protein FBU30_005520 [Linnemannia zychae]
MPSSTTSSTSSLSSVSSSRPQKFNNNRKSGLSSATQNQNHTQSCLSNNYNGDTPRHSPRVPEQITYSRQQPMSSQQRNFKNKGVNTEAGDSTLLMRQQQQQQQRQQRNQYPHPNSKSRPQSQPQPSKARRVQRRREINAETESLACIDLDMALDQSPSSNPFSPPSSSDSDDSESTMTRSTHFSSTKPFRHFLNNLPQRPRSTPALTNHAQNPNGVSRANVHQMYPSTETLSRSDSAEKAHSEKKNELYAGPTFHNSPAPTCLPIPSFARSVGSSPIEPSVEKLPTPPFFGEAASPQLNSMSLRPPHQSSQQWTGHFSAPMGSMYNVPDRMATSSFVPHGNMSDELMEISQNLRTLLKIQTQ